MNRNVIKTLVKSAFFIVTIDNARFPFSASPLVLQQNILSRKVPTNTPKVPTIVIPIELYRNDKLISNYHQKGNIQCYNAYLLLTFTAKIIMF